MKCLSCFLKPFNKQESGDIPSMQKASDKLKLAAILATATLVTGCISAKTQPVEEIAPAEPIAVVEAPPVVEAVETGPVVAEELTSWTVVEGNNLWGIASEEEVYNVPEKWPLIYKENLDKIMDPDLIFPGQVFTIPRNSSASEVDAAINHAKTRGAWTVGPVEPSDKAYLKNAN